MMKFRCPDSLSGVCTETRCGRYLVNPREDGLDDNLQPTYTAACVFDGALQYFSGLRPENEIEQTPSRDMAMPDVGAIASAVRETVVPDVEQIVRKSERNILRRIAELIGFDKLWLGIFAKLFKYKKIPGKDVAEAIEGRYADVDWSSFKHKDGIRQIKDVIDYSHDVKPITADASVKNYKKTSGGNGINLKDACRRAEELHKEAWSKMKDPYPDLDNLYAACYGLMNRKRGRNPFKMAN